MMSTHTFTSIRGALQRVDELEDAFVDEENHVSGAVVPFCWEEKPGVPLILSSNYGLEVIKEGRECESGFLTEGLMVNSSNMDKEARRNDKEKALPPLKHPMLSPLPPPPSSLQIPSHSVGVFSYDSKHSSPSLFFHVHSTKAHIKKHRGSSSPPFLSKGPMSDYVGRAYDTFRDDPFMRAIQACTQMSEMSRPTERDYNYKSNGYVGAAKKGTRDSELYSRYKSCNHVQAMAKDAGNAKNRRALMEVVADDVNRRSREISYGATKVSLSRLLMEKEGMSAGQKYEGRPAFMVASVQQQQSSKQKKAVPCKPAAHHRTASYGWLSCRSADHHESSILRIYNHRSSLS